ncbi:MAG TPA: hypothetical protein VFH95_07495 [Candidatus Kapabacteria bacterium]|nr:hypothetical protein [Candidatus Kapabacteria bacterium]
MKSRTISKIVIALAFVAVSMIGLTKESHAKGSKTIHITGLQWNGSTGSDADCPSDGSDCSMDITIIFGVQKSTDGLSWVLSGQISSPPEVEVTSGNYYGNPLNYTFPPGASLQINTGDFPGVPAQTFDLTGITTDGSGNFTASNPA